MRSRAAILHDVGGPWSGEECELDPPWTGEVPVEIVASWLCHSDDHILKEDLSASNKALRSLELPTHVPDDRLARCLDDIAGRSVLPVPLVCEHNGVHL
ncbi:hypothetical protein [Mycobacterium leprae]|uniref:hypothetical protein n=1 Tax=Mycobacterium leprae TaxID=1769 RepID=UPI000A7B8E88